MKVLIACEESQVVCIAFRNKGHEAYSCDIQECSGGHPEWHIQGDVLEQLDKGWDLMIGHPPCTYLSNAGAAWLWRGKVLNKERYKKGLKAKEFFLKLLNAPIEKIAIENPVASKVYDLPRYSQIIEPYYFGDSYKKQTCIWLKNLPYLYHSNTDDLFDKASHVTPTHHWVNASSNYRHGVLTPGPERSQKGRSKSFQGIANAMADQWG